MTSAVQFSSPNKNVLQQTNDNVPVLMEPKTEQKTPEKETQQRKKRRPSQETENRLTGAKTDANKLRKVNIDFSSQKVCAQYPLKVTCYNASSDETGEEEEEKEEEEDEEEEGENEEEFKTRKPIPRPIIPNYVTKNDKGQYRKRRKSRTDAVDLSSQKIPKPQASISIAKRNARERNRVKLVNQGFATLRSRIPDYISEIYTEEKKKKKVSKVETLRMALGYIRHLTEMLELRSTDPNQWFRIKSEEIWKNPCNSSSTGYPSPVDTEYQQSPTSGVFGSRDAPFYDYDLELETVKDQPSKEKEDEEKEPLLLTESAFSVDVGCCYDLDKTEEVDGGESKKTPPLPSITESFPKKNLRAFYETPPFLSGSSAFHV